MAGYETGTVTVNDRLARALADAVAWRGHMTDKSAVAFVAETHPRADGSYVIARAIALELVREVPRMGGYVATRKTDARVFGDAFADFVRR